jgi:ribosome-associated toxin RatA of RatAB toxin-antitoxin module
MHPKDVVFMSLCMALCSMGFLVSFLMKGQLFEAIFSGAAMLFFFGLVTCFIADAQIPQARRRSHRVG